MVLRIFQGRGCYGCCLAFTAVTFSLTYLLLSQRGSEKTRVLVPGHHPPGLIIERTGSTEHSISSFRSSSKRDDLSMTDYHQVLARHADGNNVIVLALIDSSFMDMALNFYETSLEKFSINNYLFISSDRAACTLLEPLDIHCYLYMADENAKRPTTYGTKEFKQKMNIRTFMISDALRMGFTVLHTDVDIVFLKNPLKDIRCTAGCDLVALWDSTNYNAGFVYVRPTVIGMAIYDVMVNIAFDTDFDDQRALNTGIKQVTDSSKKSGKHVGVKALSKEKYLCGEKFFEKINKYFPGSKACPQCIVVHNNWIVSLEAKRYRFREFLMWMYDGNHYYSDPSRKYLVFDLKNQNDRESQLDSLKRALFFGDVLNRTVILPRFHCNGNQECPLNSLIKMSMFDKSFNGKYRESSFLSHPKVPDSVRSSESGVDSVYWLTNETQHEQNGDKRNIILRFAGSEFPSRADIWERLGDVKSPVLHIGSFQYLNSKIPLPPQEKDFTKRLSDSFKSSKYRQLR